MENELLKKAESLISAKKKSRHYKIHAIALAVIVVLCTIYALILPAITLEQRVCDLTVHTHTDSCYDETGEIICGYADFVVHTHDSSCYDTAGDLICTLPEITEHTHTEDCYDEAGNLICKYDEIILHTHNDNCYDAKGNIICNQLEIQEHTHSEDCGWFDGEETEDEDYGIALLAEDGDISTTAVSDFMMWLFVQDSNGNYTKAAGFAKNVVSWNYDDYYDAIDDALKITDTTYYLIPVSYFVDVYGDYGYSFDETKACPFLYAPSAYNSSGNLTAASYVQLDGVWYVRIQDTGSYSNPSNPRSNIYYRYYKTVEAATHTGAVVNLFDYWITEQYAPDGNAYNDPDSGINYMHAMKFQADVMTGAPMNVWTRSDEVCQGIVSNTLTNGYPTLSGNADIGLVSSNFAAGTPLTESLAYLFDPNMAVEVNGISYKESHRNVDGLLQIDDEGYYYYDSSQNYAEYNQSTNSFTLYDEWGVYHGGRSPDGQFFPFNSMNQAAELVSTNAAINHYFGMTLTTRFIQQYDGYTGINHKSPTTFEFAGDDDVWIFIDGVLVADLGGIHDRSSVSINFATGEVSINNGSSQSTTLYDAFVAAGAADSEEWNDDHTTFANNTTHTLKFFYMERGNTDSNLKLRYNLPEIPVTSIFKVDQYGEEVDGAAFAVYTTNSDWEYLADNGNYITLDGRAYTIDETTGVITLDSGETITPKYTGTTDSSGEMIFSDEDGVPYSLRELQELFESDHFILREIAVPGGYRLVTDEIYLYIENKVLLCNNVYSSGVWASPTILVTASDTLYFMDGTAPVLYHDTDSGAVNGTLFAVVFKKDENGVWAPVYGNDLDGYNIVNVNAGENAGEEEMRNALIDAAITAARESSKYDSDVEFSISASGSMQAELIHLPGDIRTYYYMLTQNGGDGNDAEYTVAYYWTEGDLSNADASNTHRVSSDAGEPNTPAGYYGFDRNFGATIEVPNLINRLFAQKFDEEGELVNGATFALYNVAEKDNKIYYIDDDGNYILLAEDDDGDNMGDATVGAETGTYFVSADGIITVTTDSGRYTISPAKNSGLSPLVNTTTSKEINGVDEDGTCEFTNLTDGCYYLREIGAPENYELNTTEVMVLVTGDSIYANAGSAYDGVTVARGPGYVVSTLSQFASEGDIDKTLTWIYAMLKVKESSSFNLDSYGNWSYAVDKNGSLTDDKNQAMRTYLKYSPTSDNSIFNYIVNETKEEDGTIADSIEGTGTRRLYTDVGWSYLEIYQDSYYESVALASGANYTNLHDYYGEDEGDISNLFSRSVYVQVTDRKAVGNLEISKTVKNASDAADNQTFTFTVKLSDDAGNALTDAYSYTVYNIDRDTGERTAAVDSKGNVITGSITDGGTITLSDAQVAVIEDLPAKTFYSVTEAYNASYSATAVRDEGKASTNEHNGELVYTYADDDTLTADGILYWYVDEYGVLDKTSTVDYTNTYLPDITILKIATGTTTPLPDADFVFYYTVTEQTGTVKYYYNKNGGWTAYSGSDLPDDVILRSDSRGKILLYRIRDGTYYLEERAAPSGYNRMADTITVTVTDGVITRYTYSNTVQLSDDGLVLTVPNSTGYELPKTGGAGREIYLFWGMLLLLSASIPLLYRKTRERRLE